MKKTNLDSPATKRDLEDMGAHIVGAISKTLEDYATKEDLKKLATKEEMKELKNEVGGVKSDVKRLEGKIDDVASDVSDIRRRVRDVETDTVTRREFNEFKAKTLPA